MSLVIEVLGEVSPLSHFKPLFVALFGLIGCGTTRPAHATPRRPMLPPPSASERIPSYSGISAGQQIRRDVSNHLSALTPIAPRVVSTPFSGLPAEHDG